MSIFRTIAMLACAVCAILFFYFVGFAIAEHHFEPALVGVGFLVAALVLVFLQVRVGREAGARH